MGVEERELLCIVSGNVNWCNQYGKQYGNYSRNTLGYLPEEEEDTNWKDICTSMYTVYTGIIYNSQDREAA